MNEAQLRQKILTMQAEIDAERSKRIAGEIRAEVSKQAPSAPAALVAFAQATLADEQGDVASAVRSFLASDDAKPFLAPPAPVEPELKPGSYVNGRFVMREPQAPEQKVAEQGKQAASQLEQALAEIASGKAQIKFS